MQTNKNAPVGAGAKPMENDNTNNIPLPPPPVNRLKAVRQASGLNPRQMVADIRQTYPRYDKTLQSKCEHTDDYGIQLAESALKALEKRYGITKRKENRARPNRITVRFGDRQFSQLQQVLKATGKTAQDYALRAIMAAVIADLERK